MRLGDSVKTTACVSIMRLLAAHCFVSDRFTPLRHQRPTLRTSAVPVASRRFAVGRGVTAADKIARRITTNFPSFSKKTVDSSLTVASRPRRFAGIIRNLFSKRNDAASRFGATSGKAQPETLGHIGVSPLTALKSGILRSLAVDVAAVLVTAFVVAGVDLLGLLKLRMSAIPLMLTFPALALLLTFRTNAAYSRWREARSIWSGLTNKVRVLHRQGTSTPTWERGAYRFSALAVAFAYTLNVHLRDITRGKAACIAAGEHEELRADLSALLGRTDADGIMQSEHRPQAVTKAMTKVLGEANLEPSLQARVDEGISELLDDLGLCERIAKTPIPHFYTRLTAGSLCAWLLFLPSALLSFGFGFKQVLLGSTMLSATLLAIDEFGVQTEEPFSTLPTAEMCDNLRGEYERAIQSKMYSTPSTVTTPMYA